MRTLGWVGWADGGDAYAALRAMKVSRRATRSRDGGLISEIRSPARTRGFHSYVDMLTMLLYARRPVKSTKNELTGLAVWMLCVLTVVKGASEMSSILPSLMERERALPLHPPFTIPPYPLVKQAPSLQTYCPAVIVSAAYSLPRAQDALGSFSSPGLMSSTANLPHHPCPHTFPLSYIPIYHEPHSFGPLTYRATPESLGARTPGQRNRMAALSV